MASHQVFGCGTSMLSVGWEGGDVSILVLLPHLRFRKDADCSCAYYHKNIKPQTIKFNGLCLSFRKISLNDEYRCTRRQDCLSTHLFLLIRNQPEHEKKEANKFSLFLGSNLAWAVFQFPSVNAGYQMESGNDIVFLSIVSRKQYQISKGETATEYDERKEGLGGPTVLVSAAIGRKIFASN
ncbi:hypothetical protein CDAR_579451 [Caerostris darwini]|uniref:Uncharacterized protein n=1 Tax=Caerostris darwini TaxID=1538125 RepID=A0AAV4V2P0_9ARAC|nr:hypothetical protein CDAR_579451 [Caerostris darwini]